MSQASPISQRACAHNYVIREVNNYIRADEDDSLHLRMPLRKSDKTLIMDALRMIQTEDSKRVYVNRFHAAILGKKLLAGYFMPEITKHFQNFGIRGDLISIMDNESLTFHDRMAALCRL